MITASGCALFFLAVKPLRPYVVRAWAATAGFIIFAIPGVGLLVFPAANKDPNGLPAPPNLIGAELSATDFAALESRCRCSRERLGSFRACRAGAAPTQARCGRRLFGVESRPRQGIDDHLAAVGPEAVLGEIARVRFTAFNWREELIRAKPTPAHPQGNIYPVSPRSPPVCTSYWELGNNRTVMDKRFRNTRRRFG